jgi:hypothetical protein
MSFRDVQGVPLNVRVFENGGQYQNGALFGMSQADAGKTVCGKTRNMPVSSQDVADNPSVNVGEPIVAAGVPIS